MKNYRPYAFWTRKELSYHLFKQADAIKAPDWVRKIIEEAVNDESWEPTKDFDGCSIVQDIYHPCVACFIHDYLWKTGRGGSLSDFIFYQIMLIDGTGKKRAKRRWLGVRLGWILKFKWKHLMNRNIEPFSEIMLEVLKMRKDGKFN